MRTCTTTYCGPLAALGRRGLANECLAGHRHGHGNLDSDAKPYLNTPSDLHAQANSCADASSGRGARAL